MTKLISGQDIRQTREEGVEITLASGVTVKIRNVPLSQLLLSGKIPDSLSGIAAAAIIEPGSEVPSDISNTEAIKKYLKLSNMIVRLALVYPKIVDDPQNDDEFALSDFSDAERGEIFAYSRHATERLRWFRDQQNAIVAALSEVQNVQPVAEQPTTD